MTQRMFSDEIRSKTLKKKWRQFESWKERRGGMWENLKKDKSWCRGSGRASSLADSLLSPAQLLRIFFSSGERDEEKCCPKEHEDVFEMRWGKPEADMEWRGPDPTQYSQGKMNVAQLFAPGLCHSVFWRCRGQVVCALPRPRPVLRRWRLRRQSVHSPELLSSSAPCSLQHCPTVDSSAVDVQLEHK